jgi:hypothetical protein
MYTSQPHERAVFLAGGIAGCPDWQAWMVERLRDAPFDLLNPRRAHFPIHDPDAAAAQITWEFAHLRRAYAILFWFPCETLCPIVLYELGAWSMTDRPIYIGVHPDYQRKSDVIIQTRLIRPHIQVVFSLEELAQQILDDDQMGTRQIRH